MSDTVLIVPGYRGSGAAHWQTWLGAELPGSRRVEGIDWEAPVLPEWTREIHKEIDIARGRVWIVAHSFGCLASVVVAAERKEKIAGAILVAPADPERFSPSGVRQSDVTGFIESSITSLIPQAPLDTVKSVLVASENDPWFEFRYAALWADRWGSTVVNLGRAGHINTESGFGPWPFVKDLLFSLQEGRNDVREPGLPEVAGDDDVFLQLEKLEASKTWRSFFHNYLQFTY